jgi:hypothetical protein
MMASELFFLLFVLLPPTQSGATGDLKSEEIPRDKDPFVVPARTSGNLGTCRKALVYPPRHLSKTEMAAARLRLVPEALPIGLRWLEKPYHRPHDWLLLQLLPSPNP